MWLGSGEGQNKAIASTFAAMDALKNNATLLAECNAKKVEAAGLKKQKMEVWRREHGVETSEQAKNNEQVADRGKEVGKSAMAEKKHKHARDDDDDDVDTNGDPSERKKKSKRDRTHKASEANTA